MITFSRR